MNLVKLITAVTLLGFLSACEVSGPKIKLPDLVIKTNNGNGNGNGHCPPGQAKKGNC